MKLHDYNQMMGYMKRRAFADGSPEPTTTFNDKIETLKEASPGLMPRSRVAILKGYMDDALKDGEITQEQHTQMLMPYFGELGEKVTEQIAVSDRDNFAIGGGQFEGTDLGTREGFSKYEGARGKARKKGTTINNLFNEDPTLKKNILKEYNKGSGADRIIRDLNLKDKVSPRALQDYINEQLNTGKFKTRKANKAPDVVKQPGEESKKFMEYIENIIDENPGKKNMFQNLEASDVIKNSGADINTANATRILSKIYNLATKGAKLEKFYPNIEKRAIELIDTGMGTPDITNTLINEGLIEKQVEKNNKTSYRATKNYFQRLIDDKKTKIKKLTAQPGDIVDVVTRNYRDEAIKNLLDQQSSPITSNRIATTVSEELGEKISSEYVKSFFKRNNIDIDKYIQTSAQRIFPEVETLDKIVKKNIKYLTDPNVTFVDKGQFLSNEYTKIIGKSKAQTVTANEAGLRLKKLLSIYAGTDQRYGKDLYAKIKPLSNYTDSNIQKNLISLTTNLARSSNVEVAKMLGLPKKDIQLLQDLQKANSELGDFKLAGDHTDIKAIMSDFPNYKKNFMRIQYISNDLNTFKSTYDKKIIALYNSAKAGAASETIIPKLEKIQNDFKTKTGYDIGGFSFKKNGKIAIDPQTVAINEYRYPINDNVIKTMGNIESYENKKYKNPFDKEVMAAQGSPNKLKAVYEKYKGNVKVINNSKYVKGLDNVPKLKGFKNALLYGGAGTAAIFATAANADTNDDMFAPVDPGIIVPQENKEEFDPERAEPGLGVTAAAAPLATQKGRNLYGKFAKQIAKGLGNTVRAVGSPLTGLTLAATELASDDPSLGQAGAELLLPEQIRRVAGKLPKGIMSNFFGLQGLSKFGKLGALAARAPSVMTPVGLTMLGAEGIKKLYDEEQKKNRMIEAMDPEERLQFLQEEKDTEELMSRASAAYGGRMGFADGPEDPKKRKFMKIMGGLASIPLLGRFIDIGTQAPKVAELVRRGTDGVPDFLMDLIAKVKAGAEAKGLKYFTGNKPEEFKDVYQLDNYIVTEKGNKTIIREVDQDGNMLYKENQMEIDYDPETGGYTYNEASARPDAEGKLKDVEEYIEEDDLENMRKYTYDE